MSSTDNPDQVRPALRKAEAALARHLQEACETHDPASLEEESTDELLRLEEELLAAARAADEAVRLRRKLGEAEKGGSVQQRQPAEPPSAAAEAPRIRVREFRTGSGSEWRVWEVRPGIGGRPRKAGLYPPDYEEGWLAFELLQGEERKRLPKFAPEWCDCGDADLELLLHKAVDVPKRRKQGPPEAGGPAKQA